MLIESATTFRAILVEDNPGDARLMREVLADATGAAFDLVHVDRLTEALLRVVQEQFDVLLLDLSLPDSQGLATLTTAQSAVPDMPIIVLTGFADAATAVRAVQMGAEDYLVKGEVDGATLIRSIRYAIERRRAELARTQLIREQAARADVEAALRLRDEFLATVSHDLKNPLTSIKGMSQLLARQVHQLNVPDVERIAAGLLTIDQRATSMLALINELLDVARLQAGQPLEMEFQPIDLVALANQVAGEYQRMTHEHTIVVDTIVDGLVVEVDRFRFERVLSNLVSNAIKYSPNGGEITITIRPVDRDGTPAARVIVRDRGIGIPYVDLPRVFERFQRATNVGQISGTGIGLNSARHIIEQHHGSIAIQSEEGRGTAIEVSVPLVHTPIGEAR